jgi:hypothetical protein
LRNRHDKPVVSGFDFGAGLEWILAEERSAFLIIPIAAKAGMPSAAVNKKTARSLT